MAFKSLAFLIAMTLIVSLVMSASNAAYSRKLFSGIKASSVSEGEGNLVECGNALVEVKSCSQEIVVYFLNGRADIGADCCKAIAIITRRCWPTMLTSLGFTAKQGDILRGYCDAETYDKLPATTVPAPAPTPLLAPF